MLRVHQLEEISGLMLRLPALVHEQETRAAAFIDHTNEWLLALEKALSSCRLHQAGSVAMLRSDIAATLRGQTPASVQLRGRETRSRLRNAAAAQALQGAAAIASAIVAENQPRVAEAERVAQQIVAVAIARGGILDRHVGLTNGEYLREIRKTLMAHVELQNAAMHLDGLVGPYDSLVLIDRVLAPHLSIASIEGHR